MSELENHFFRGFFEGVLDKEAGAPQVVAAQAARKAGGGAIRQLIGKYPLTTAGTAIAAGAGGAAALDAHQDKQEALAKRREQIRQLLMQRLMHHGYGG